uniref:Family with sequence similarity 110 member A n=1 Tax=Esox lucius TaxID=8010 RepID=A0AAY5K7M9_ESOLU
MPVETLQASGGRLAGVPFTSAMPFRILNKGPEYFRRPVEPGARKLSAVERLEADKAKYVKSQQVALTRQEPVKPPIIRKPLLSPGGAAGVGWRRGPPLNLEILNNLINNVCDGPEPGRRPPPVPARGARLGFPVPYSSPNSVTVRRVDVRPQAVTRTLQRAPALIKPRQTAQPQVAHSQASPPPQQCQPPTPSMALPSTPLYLPPSPMLIRAGMMPPASPAFTRLSSASSRGSRPGSARKHPSLHRSKSDLSDRYSRATADLERFFNYCGLHPDEVEGMGGVERFARASSDIVSVSKLRSVSTPSSECERAREQGEDEDEEGSAQPGERVPYGISVIERNARVIKWLYGIRQARDNTTVSNV